VDRGKRLLSKLYGGSDYAGPSREQIKEFRNETGFADAAPIFAESFRQWVIEDVFADGRPDWDRVGAQFVEDVTPYEAMKLRLLNASHLAIAGLGSLCLYQSVIETIGDPLIRRYMVRLMDTETGPTLPPVPGIDLAAYKATLLERFANPASAIRCGGSMPMHPSICYWIRYGTDWRSMRQSICWRSLWPPGAAACKSRRENQSKGGPWAGLKRCCRSTPGPNRIRHPSC